MYLNDVLKSGQYVMPVPLGLPAVLQYDENGVIQRVYKRFEEHTINISHELLDVLFNDKIIPNKIPIKGGTTYVSGVFWCNYIPPYNGNLPEGTENSLIQFIIDNYENSDDVKFYAGNVKSLAVAFNGAVPIRQWLKMNKFNVLPGFLVPVKVTRESIMATFCNGDHPFNSPLISHYMIYDKSSFRIVSTELSGHIVTKDPERFLNSTGQIKSKIVGDNWSLVTDYSDIVHYNIVKGTYLILDKYNKIIYSLFPVNADVSNKTHCTVCGKLIKIPISGEVCCEDINCLSRLYPDILHFLNSLNLPIVSYEKYMSYVQCDELTTFSDIMLLPEYKDIEVSTSLAELLKAIIPIRDVRNRHIIEIFVNNCNQSKSVINHYMNHPDNIIEDLSMPNTTDVLSLVNWFKDIEHTSTVSTLMYVENIKIDDTLKKFEGAPIFRGKSIAVTGSFNHGSLSEIACILRSYSAEVTLNLTDDTNLVLVGSLQENTNGVLINSARMRNIPVMEEFQFFRQYEIDEDLKANLL